MAQQMKITPQETQVLKAIPDWGCDITILEEKTGIPRASIRRCLSNLKKNNLVAVDGLTWRAVK